MGRFHVAFRPDKCKGCGLCMDICPKKLIVMAKHVNAKGYFPASMRSEDADACIGCASCALMCPDGAIEVFLVDEGGSAK